MKKSITPNQIKQNNRNLIYHFIYKNKKVSQQDIAYELCLSRPTVTSNLNALEEDGLIQKCGQLDSEYVGRKATAYSIVPDFRISIGVEILRKEIKMIAIDLYGKKIDRSVIKTDYKNEEAYFKQVSSSIIDFKNSIGAADEQILGVGFAMQALISADNQTVIYGKILSCTGLSIDMFSRYLPYPCTFIHDANSAAIAELWISPELQDAFYLSLSKHLGAAIISKRNILVGKHGHSSTIEHIPLEPDGKLCYCGKRGCMETLCSLTSLLGEEETLENFFLQLQENDPSITKRWNHYLQNLAKVINTLHLVHDTDFILGGYLAPYLRDADIRFMYEIIQQMTPFDEEQDFIVISKMPKHNICIGAALPYIQNFLNTLTKQS
ncbi:MAG: ROK family transcriptional regulator [Lachnospiraceae bacterium]|nr:ROK family transcriptional regulator [Lachnospiraceae bacterium]